MNNIINFTDKKKLSSYILPFTLDGAKVRGRLVRLGSALSDVLKKHQYPNIINQYIGEMIALASALIMDIKTNGMITLQITNGSIIRMIVVNVSTDGDIRGCATWNDSALADLLTNTAKPSLAQLFAAGNLIFTVELDNQTENYQAIVELSGATLSDCMHHYFRQSDQVPTGLFVCTNFVNASTNNHNDYLAGALLIQRTPIDPLADAELIHKEEDEWFTDISLLSTITPNELLSNTLSPGTVLHRLFHERDLQISEKKVIQANCHCSRHRLEGILVNFSITDLNEVSIDGKIDICCEFCNENYTFSEQEIKHLKESRTDKN